MIEILDFHADWCGPCQMLKPIVDEIESEGIAKVRRIDVDSDPEVAAEYEVHSLPTLIVLKDEEVRQQMTGHISKAEILSAIAFCK